MPRSALRCVAMLLATACGASTAVPTADLHDQQDGGAATDPWNERLAAAEGEAQSALDEAIAEFERFLNEQPPSTEYTPDAMLRLADLYRERVLLDSGGDRPPDLSATLALYRAILADYPQYPHRDAVLYLLGVDLFETGPVDDAVRVLRALVCANRYPLEQATLAGKDGDALYAAVDLYEDCEPAHADSRFLLPSWFLIGEYHHDYATTPAGLLGAVAAYSRVLSGEDHDLKSLAMYKIGWAYYRADQYPEAINSFAALIEQMERKPNGKAVTLRPEAITYMAICLAEEDWDGDGQPDERSGLERLQDPAFIDQRASWLVEVCHCLGGVYLDMAREDTATRVLETCLNYPELAHLPEVAHARGQLNARELADLIGRLIEKSKSER